MVVRAPDGAGVEKKTARRRKIGRHRIDCDDDVRIALGNRKPAHRLGKRPPQRFIGVTNADRDIGNANDLARRVAHSQNGIAYEPGTLQARTPRQPSDDGPLAAFVLQKPRTASSGRSGKRFASGFSYFFFSLRSCCIVLPFLTSDRARNRTTTTTSGTASSGGRLY